MSKLKGDTIPGIVAAGIGAAAGIMTLSDPDKLFLGESAKKGLIPGPGFFPLVCSALMVIFGICLIIRGIKQNGGVHFFKMTLEIKENLRVVLLTLAGLVVFLILWKDVSKLFILWVALYTTFLCRVFKRSWPFTIIFVAVMTGLIYFMFMVGFSVTFRVF